MVDQKSDNLALLYEFFDWEGAEYLENYELINLNYHIYEVFHHVEQTEFRQQYNPIENRDSDRELRIRNIILGNVHRF